MLTCTVLECAIRLPLQSVERADALFQFEPRFLNDAEMTARHATKRDDSSRVMWD